MNVLTSRIPMFAYDAIPIPLFTKYLTIFLLMNNKNASDWCIDFYIFEFVIVFLFFENIILYSIWVPQKAVRKNEYFLTFGYSLNWLPKLTFGNWIHRWTVRAIEVISEFRPISKWTEYTESIWWMFIAINNLFHWFCKMNKNQFCIFFNKTLLDWCCNEWFVNLVELSSNKTVLLRSKTFALACIPNQATLALAHFHFPIFDKQDMPPWCHHCQRYSHLGFCRLSTNSKL